QWNRRQTPPPGSTLRLPEGQDHGDQTAPLEDPFPGDVEGTEDGGEETETPGAGDKLEQRGFPTVEGKAQAGEQEGAEGHRHGNGEGGAEYNVRHVAHLEDESGAAQQEGELGAIVRGNPARIGLKGHADELVGFDEPVGYRCFQMEVTRMIAADGPESPAVHGTGDG